MMKLISRFAAWRQLMWQSWCAVAMVVISMAIARAILYLAYAPKPLQASGFEVLSAFVLGARFDAKLFITFLALWILLAFLAWALPRWFLNILNRYYVIYWTLGIISVMLLAFINFYYFGFYQTPINALIFGLAEDDTTAILKSIWHDFPLIPLILLLVLLAALQVWLIKITVKKLQNIASDFKHPAYIIGSVVVNILLVAMLARGSFGVFPLNKNDADLSANAFVNHSVFSGGYALYNAYQDRKSNRIDTNANKIIRALGFDSPEDAAKVLQSDNADDFLWTTTPKNPAIEQHPPNVVMAIMESFGRHLLAFDDAKNNDLLAALRPWVEGGMDYFPHAISYQNGTHPSLEGFLLDSPITPLTQAFGFQQYLQSVVLPYKNAGYRTIFITAGSLQWRSIGSMLRYQGFAETYGAGAIMAKYPAAKMGDWGVDDEYLFHFAEDIFKAQDARPIMMVLLTITNHPPYQLPADYDLKPIDWHHVAKRMNSSPELSQAILATYQYANNSLGEFLNYLKSSGKLDHTLVAASGDHNSRSIFYYPDTAELFYKYGVPILMYIPPQYRGGDQAQVQDWVAHQDIFPTLFHYSLSNAKVPRTGRNIYQPSALANAVSFIDDGNGAGVLINQYGAATNFSAPKYYQWNQSHSQLQPTDQPSEPLTKATAAAKAWLALRDWRVRSQLQHNLKK